MKRNETVSVRISAKHHAALKKMTRTGGQTISWLVNLAIDLYLQEIEKNRVDLEQQKATLALVREGNTP